MKQLRKVLILLTLVSICSSSLAYAEPERPEVRRPTEGTGEMDKLPDKDKDKDKNDKEEEDKDSSKKDKYTIDNTGEAMDEPVGDSKLPTSFNDCKYYDSYIPYKLVPNDIGGWCIGVTNTSRPYGPMSQDSINNVHMGGYVNYEFDKLLSKYGESYYEEDTGMSIVKDKNGVEYYGTAIQGFFYNNSSVGKDGFPAWNDQTQLGQIFDVILTDGTVIHFIVADLNSNYHTNGGYGDKPSDGHPTADGVWSYSDMKKEQYWNLYAAMSGNQLEVWGKSGCASKLAKKFNLGTGEDTNKIAYYRMYNRNISDPPEPVSDDVKGVSYKLGEVDIQGGNKNDKTDIGGVVSTGLFAETDFVKWKSSETENIEFPFMEWMKNEDISDVENWKADLEKKNDESILIKGGRWLTILFGIIFEVWMLLIYISYWFDRLNNFFDYSLLNLVTFGRLSISPDEDECTFSLTSLGKHEKRTVNHRKILEVVIIGLAFGTLIVSGVFFSILSSVVNKILEILY